MVERGGNGGGTLKRWVGHALSSCQLLRVLCVLSCDHRLLTQIQFGRLPDLTRASHSHTGKPLMAQSFLFSPMLCDHQCTKMV